MYRLNPTKIQKLKLAHVNKSRKYCWDGVSISDNYARVIVCIGYHFVGPKFEEKFDAKTSSGSMKNAVSPVSLDDPPNSGVGEVAAT